MLLCLWDSVGVALVSYTRSDDFKVIFWAYFIDRQGFR